MNADLDSGCKLEICKCPICGELATGVFERLFAVAMIAVDEDTGEASYIGESEIDWCSQRPVEDPTAAEEKLMLICDNGHRWSSSFETTE